MTHPYLFTLLLIFLVACNSTQPSPPSNPTNIKETTVPPNEPQPQEDPSILLSFAGDTMMAGKVGDIVKEKGTAYPFTDAAPIFHNSDLVMLNLETAISQKGDKQEKQYTFRSTPEMALALKKAGVDIVTVANNHALDFGPQAFLDTLAYLERAGLKHVGGGANQEEAYAPVTFHVHEKTIQFFGFSRVLAEANWHAGLKHPGMASAYDPLLVYQHVEASIAKSDYTVVYLHWGKELAEHPLPYQTQLAHGLIDLGVDLVIGSHPHVLQGMEWYKGKLIAYSLGNFVFTTSRLEEGRLTGILQVALKGDHIIPRFVPMYIDQGAVWLAKEEQSVKIMDRLQRLSKHGSWNEDKIFEQIE